MSKITTDLYVGGLLTCDTFQPPSNCIANAAIRTDAAIARSKLAQDVLKPYQIPLTDLLVWDAPNTKLPTTPGNDDLGLVLGTFGTDMLTVQTGDSKAASTTRYGRFLFPLPAEYDTRQTVIVRVGGNMLTTEADTSALVDVQAYAHDANWDITADLCSTAAQSMNNLAYDEYDFNITASGLGPENILDIRVSIAIVDSATVTAVTGCIKHITVCCDVRG